MYIENRVPELAEVESSVQIYGVWSGVDVDIASVTLFPSEERLTVQDGCFVPVNSVVDVQTNS